jgi:hypothetical protein
MCKKRINLMKIILKIILYAVIILFLSIVLDEKADSKTEQAIPKVSTFTSRTKVRAIPYDICGKIKIKNPVYKEKIALNSNLELDH